MARTAFSIVPFVLMLSASMAAVHFCIVAAPATAAEPESLQTERTIDTAPNAEQNSRLKAETRTLLATVIKTLGGAQPATCNFASQWTTETVPKEELIKFFGEAPELISEAPPFEISDVIEIPNGSQVFCSVDQFHEYVDKTIADRSRSGDVSWHETMYTVKFGFPVFDHDYNRAAIFIESVGQMSPDEIFLEGFGSFRLYRKAGTGWEEAGAK